VRPSNAETDAVAKAHERFRRLLERANQERMRDLEVAGISLADLTMDDLEQLVRRGLADADRLALHKSISAPFVGVPSEEIEREVDLALAEVRAEMRAQRTAAKTGS
jgi:hypothetical protein